MMTGGQAQLFMGESTDTSDAATHVTHEKIQRSTVALPVMVANATEMAAHEKFLDVITKKGRCVWREL